MKILTVLPSIHVANLHKFIDSFHATSAVSDLIILTERKSITKVFNEAFKKYDDYDFYFMANDDIEFKTKDWDIKLANRNKISYGNDTLQGENLCTFPMIDGDIVRKLGWLQMPFLHHYCGDNVWYFIGKNTDTLLYFDDVIIKHNWNGNQNEDVLVNDMSAFSKWLPESNSDVIKIKELVNGKNSL